MGIRQESTRFALRTRGPGLYEFTDEVVSWVRQSGINTGLLTLHVKHTSASLMIQENADPTVRGDMRRFFERLVPRGDRIFRHTSEGPDDMPAHVRSALTATSLSIPVENSVPTLGTWQGIYLFEHRDAVHRRRVAAHLIGE
jgi:secondary thiamine-phosphate synthase enzyme